MRKLNIKVITTLLSSFLIFASLNGVNQKKIYKQGDFVASENAYFDHEITDPAELVKAHKFVTPSDNKYNSQKTRSLGTSLIGDIETVWDSYTGKGTTVAIIDDGFDYNHPEFTRKDGSSAILSSSRYYYASGNTAYYQSYDTDPSCIAEDWEDEDEDGKYEWATHGTNTSSTAAAPMNNGGGVGIAPEADILALKIDMSFAAIKAAINYAVAQDVDVINMSLGAYAESFTDGWGDAHSGTSSTATLLESACQNAYNNGVIVVAAAGNESTWHKSYPACNYKVIGVGALGDWDNKGNANELAEFTNYVKSNQTGEINVDILAPGYVYTATQAGTQNSVSHTYSDTQGTSFSSPIVAGAACLWKEKYPDGTPTEFLNAIQSTADGIGYYTDKMIPVSGWDSELSDAGPSNITNGRLNVAKLLDIDNPYVSTSQENINITIGEHKQITLDSYNGAITYSSSNSNIASVDSNGLIEGVGAGNATITITATKNAKTATDTINVTVNEVVAMTSLSFDNSSITLDIGDTFNAEEIITVTPNNASRVFLFESEDESVATVDDKTGLITAIGAGTTNINAIAVYGDGFDTLEVIVNTPSTPSSWDRINDTSQLTSGDYLIVYEAGSKAFNGQLNGLDVVNNNVSVSINNGTIAYNNATVAAKFTISPISGGYSIQSASGYYIGRESGSNGMDTSTSNAYANLISFSGNNAIISGSGGKTLYFNTANDQQRFRYMSNGGDIQLYKASGASGPIPVVGSVTVSPSNLSLDVYNNPTGNLTATVNGTNNPSQSVNWSSNNPGVATVNSSGVVTAISAGVATITATSVIDNTKSGSAVITVTNSTPKDLSNIVISGNYKTSFNVGDTFSFGGTVTANFSDSSSLDVTNSASFSGYNMNSAGNQTVTVSYTYNQVTKTTTYNINVSNRSSGTYVIGWGNASGSAGTYSNFSATSGNVDSILSFSCAQNSAQNAPAYNSSNNELRLYYGSAGNGGSITIVPAEDVVFTGFSMTTSTAPTVKYRADDGGLTAVSNNNNVYTASNFRAESSLTIQNANTSNTQLRILTISLTYELPDLSDKIVNSLTATYSGGDLYVGDNLDTSKVSVTASYTDSVKYPNALLASSDYSLTGFSSAASGNKVVTVTYIGPLTTSTSPLTTTFDVNVKNDSVSNVTVTNNTTYHPGETISKNDITVTLSWESGKGDTTTEDFIFSGDGYQFTYSDAPSGGSTANKVFSISYNQVNYNFTVKVSRVAYQNISNIYNTLSNSQFASSTVSKSSGTASNENVTIGEFGFTVTTNAYIFTTNNTNYLSFGKNAGSIKNTNAFSYDLLSVGVTVKSGSRTDGKLYISKTGANNDWVAYSNNEVSNGGYRYFKYEFVGTSSGSGAAAYSNIETITFSFKGVDNVNNVSNYIMYEDINNQCLTKLDIAIEKLNTMSSEDKNSFYTSNDYVIRCARERLEAWAISQGKSLSFSEDNFAINAERNNLLQSSINSDNNLTIVISIISLISISSFALYLFVKNKKEN